MLWGVEKNARVITTADIAATVNMTQRVRNKILVPRNAGIIVTTKMATVNAKPAGAIEMVRAWFIQFSFDDICPSAASIGPIPYTGIVPITTAMNDMSPNVMNRFVINPNEGCIILLTQT
jgi:hypothetical protein